MLKNGEYQVKISKHLLIVLALFINSAVFAATYGGGTGDPNNPYQIWTPEQMNTIGANSGDWNKCFILLADVNMAAYTGTQYNIIGTNWFNAFTGKFDGNGHKIVNLTYNDPNNDYVGLFGRTGSGAEIKNLSLEDVNIIGPSYVGGLIGYNNGSRMIINCNSSGIVNGIISVGGLIGENNEGNVTNCYSTCNVTGDSYVGGLIGLNNYGSISNCYSTCDVSGRTYIGGLIGLTMESLTNLYISNCYFTGSVNGSSSVGGLVGLCGINIDNCYATGLVSGTEASVGGLIGYMNRGAISNCYSTCDVSSDRWVGGLIGYNSAGLISCCYSKGNIVTSRYGIGGLIGQQDFGATSNCYSTGNVSGNKYVGGLIGVAGIAGVGRLETATSNCYSTGNVSGNEYVGGLIGSTSGCAIGNCYSTGSVSGSSFVAGLIGKNNSEGNIIACFWDITKSGKSNGVGIGSSNGIYGRTTTEMMQQTTFATSPYLWDFLGEKNNGTEDLWRMCIDGVSYPKLKWEFAQSDFTCPDGVNVEDLGYLEEQWLLIKLTADISPTKGNGAVNFHDWTVFAKAWKTTPTNLRWNPVCDIAPIGGDNVIDTYDLIAFVDQWQQRGAANTDIAPAPNGDKIVNFLDFAILADYWLE